MLKLILKIYTIEAILRNKFSLYHYKSDGEGYLFKRGIILFYILAKRHGC